jgi:hypothetical protein
VVYGASHRAGQLGETSPLRPLLRDRVVTCSHSRSRLRRVGSTVGSTLGASVGGASVGEGVVSERFREISTADG